MQRTRFDEMQCAIAQTAEVIGNPWTLLILREAFFGTTRFGKFEKRLGIAKNILTQRLEHLVGHGIMTREALPPNGKRFEYRLTPKGTDLLTVVFALRDWSDRWTYGAGSEPLLVTDRRTGKRVPPLQIRDDRGKLIPPSELQIVPGPGADAPILKRFGVGAKGARSLDAQSSQQETS